MKTTVLLLLGGLLLAIPAIAQVPTDVLTTPPPADARGAVVRPVPITDPTQSIAVRCVDTSGTSFEACGGAWSADPVTWRKMAKKQVEPTKRTEYPDGTESGRYYRVPLSEFRWTVGPKSQKRVEAGARIGRLRSRSDDFRHSDE